MKTFNDLEFNKHSASLSDEVKEELVSKGIIESDDDLLSEMTQAVMTFDNGLQISVVFGKTFYSNGIDTYEAWCSELDSDPRGYLTEFGVTEYMKEIQEK